MRIVYGILAFLLFGGAVGGINLEQIQKNQGVPNDPAKRQAYIIGMFIPPIGMLCIGVGCGYLALRNHRKPDQQD